MTKPPVILTFLAPAEQCNQRCPACILDRIGEPVREVGLEPLDYAQIIEELVNADVPVVAVSFQGFEVTLPASWRYLEAAFHSAQRHQIRRAFITNGMLLHKHTGRIVDLDPHRISVSLDGADAEVNDRLRGLPGAFDATVSSLRRFLEMAPHLASRVAIASTLYDEANARSLIGMPRLLRSLGVSRWAMAFEIDIRDGLQRPVQSQAALARWLEPLSSAAVSAGIRFHINDELGFFESAGTEDTLRSAAKRLIQPDSLVRVEPTGHVRIGQEVLREWTPPSRRYRPGRGNFARLIGY